MGTWTNGEVASKVDYEGGIFEALQWGLRSEDIKDTDLADLWSELEDLYKKMPIQEIYNILDEADREDYE